jgi:hypothetical protein
MVSQPKLQVIQLSGPVVLDWGNGLRLVLSPAPTTPERAQATEAAGLQRGRPGRKPTPATMAFHAAMVTDAVAGTPRRRTAYVHILRDAGFTGSATGAGVILRREAKRHFGRALGREHPARASPKPPTGGRRQGRKPSEATRALSDAMQADAGSGKPRTSEEYLAVLRSAGHAGSDNSARMILAREARRTFGHSLGGRGPNKRGKRARRAGAAPTPLFRAKLAEDAASGEARKAAWYVKWLVDQPGVKLGLKGARPIVYRELRAFRVNPT